MVHHGFNVQWMFNAHAGAAGPDERVLDAVAAWGSNSVRLPTDYRLWSVGGDPYPADESVPALIDQTVDACRQRHRRPGAVFERRDDFDVDAHLDLMRSF